MHIPYSDNKNIALFQENNKTVPLVYFNIINLIFGKEKSIMSSIEERVKNIIVTQLGVNADEVKNESKFIDDLGADSLDTVELVMALEEEFETEIPDEDAEKITSVQEAIDYVNSNQ